MEYTFDIFEPQADQEAAFRDLQGRFSALYTEGWENQGKKLYKAEFALNVGVFARMWLEKGLRIFLAFEKGNPDPVGYLLAVVFNPMARSSVTAMQIESWYARNNNTEVIDGLFSFVSNACRFMGVDELWMGVVPNEYQPKLPETWKPYVSYETRSFKRG